jgi:hypothetical protein
VKKNKALIVFFFYKRGLIKNQPNAKHGCTKAIGGEMRASNNNEAIESERGRDATRNISMLPASVREENNRETTQSQISTGEDNER